MKRYTTRSVPADVVQTSSHDSTPAACSLQTPPWRWALAQHRTPFSQPGRTRQRASRATLTGGTARAATLGIFTTALPAQSHGHLRPGRWSPVSLRRDSRPSCGSAALAPYRRAASQRGGGTTRLVADACAAGVAVVKKVAARFSLRGLRAQIDTIAHATESHGVRRATVAVAWRTGAQRACRVWCDCTLHLQSGRAFVRRPGSTEPAPLLTDMRRVECLSVCPAGRCGRLAPARARRREARAV